MRFTCLSAALVLACTSPMVASADQPLKKSDFGAIDAGSLLSLPVPDVPGKSAQARKPSWTASISRPTHRFSAADRSATLEAIRFTLNEVGDGATFVWKRKKSAMNGTIKAIGSFRDADGRICRHLKMAVRASLLIHRIEGTACRAPDGIWQLEG